MTSVVVGEKPPPSRRIPSSPGSLQHRWPYLSSVRVREGRGETSVPVILTQDFHDDDEPGPPQMRPPQLEWPFLYFCRSWTRQLFPVAGLYSSTFLSELSGNPPDMRNPGTINNCQRTPSMRLYNVITISRQIICSYQDMNTVESQHFSPRNIFRH